MRLSLITFSILIVPTVSAQTYCSLAVEVVNSDGAKVSGVQVTVAERSGRLAFARTTNGEARFCDLGLYRVMVTVGSEGSCNHTVVSNVPLTWGITIRKRVEHDTRICTVDGPTPIFPCRILLRFSDESGGGLSGVKFLPPLPNSSDKQSDEYGRAIVMMKSAEHVETLAQRDGYATAPIDLTCRGRSGLIEDEQTITLRRIP